MVCLQNIWMGYELPKRVICKCSLLVGSYCGTLKRGCEVVSLQFLETLAMDIECHRRLL